MIEDAGLFRRYLLGELDDSEQENLERQLMVSDEDFQELLIAEDEIVDDYCAGNLSASQEQEYRDRFLITPERLHQDRFGAALRRRLAAATPEPAPALTDRPLRRPLSPVWRLPLAAAVAALIAAGAWWVLQDQRFPVQLEETARLEGPTAAFYLTTGDFRSLQAEAEQTITVPAGVALVDLQLDLPADSGVDHEVTLEDARNGTILAAGMLPAQTIEGQWIVVATVPSELLIPGEYRVILRARSTDGELAPLETYAFRVAR